MECKIFFLHFAFHIFQIGGGESAGVAVISVQISGAPSSAAFRDDSQCGQAQIDSLSSSFGVWVSVPSSEVQVSSCSNTAVSSSTTTTTTANPVTNVSTAFPDSSTSMDSTPSYMSISTSRTNWPLNTTSVVSTSSSSTVTTPTATTSETPGSNPDTTIRSTTTWMSNATSSPSTTTRSSEVTSSPSSSTRSSDVTSSPSTTTWSSDVTTSITPASFSSDATSESSSTSKSTISFTQQYTSSSSSSPTSIITSSFPTPSSTMPTYTTSTAISMSSTSISTSVTYTRTTLSSSSTTESSSSTKTVPSVCPGIPPPAVAGVYSTDERNAYCTLAEGEGSYCKCTQISAGQLCQSVRGGFGLSCNCSLMCPKKTLLRRLLSGDSFLVDTDVMFVVSSGSTVKELLDSLGENENTFRAAMGFSESVVVSVQSFLYIPGGLDPSTASQGGTVFALIDFSVASSSSNSFRRLVQTDTSLQTAISESIGDLVPFPRDSQISCEIQNTGSSRIKANVSIQVGSNLETSTTAMAAFLRSDVNGKNQLPSLISSKSATPIAYSPDYVPIVWSVLAGLLVAVVILPYVLAGVGAGVAVLAMLIYRYRYVIRSTCNQLLDFLKLKRENLGISRGWTVGRFLARFPESDKLEVSSTPDTATNFGEDDFDDLILRNIRINSQVT